MTNTVDRQKDLITQASCVLHIGTPKTGSTALQRFLCEARHALENAGFLYPASIERGHGHHDLSLALCASYPEWAAPQLRTFEESLSAVIAEHRSKELKLLLSSENFYWLNRPEDVAWLLQRLGHSTERVAIIVYLRRQDEVLVSWYNQLVKAQGYARDFSSFIDEQGELWNYAIQLQQWSAVFGSERIAVRRYAFGVKDDIRHDIAKLLDLEVGIEPTSQRENNRLLRDILEFQRTINQLPLPTIEKRRFHKTLIALSDRASNSAEALFSDAPLLTPASARAILARYEEGNDWVARHFLDEPHLFDQGDAETPEELAGTAYEPLGPEKIAAILSWLILEVAHHSTSDVSVPP